MPDRSTEPAPERFYTRLSDRIDRLECNQSFLQCHKRIAQARFDVGQCVKRIARARFDVGEEVSLIEPTASRSRGSMTRMAFSAGGDGVTGIEASRDRHQCVLSS